MEVAPENVAGRKIESHEFHHHVRWDYLVAGLVFAYVAYKVFGGLADRDDRTDHAGDVDDRTIEVEQVGGLASDLR